MSLEATIFAVALAGAMIVFVVLPLLSGDPEPPARYVARGVSGRQRQALETLWAEKNRVLRSIRDLDFDYDMDKLTDETYAAQRIALIRLAVAIIMRMDDLEADITAQQERIETAIAALRQTRQPQPDKASSRGRVQTR